MPHTLLTLQYLQALNNHSVNVSQLVNKRIDRLLAELATGLAIDPWDMVDGAVELQDRFAEDI